MQELHYDAPSQVQDAIAALAGGGARVLAGGTDLIPQLREGRRQVSRVVDLKRIPELTNIERAGDGSWRIGAAASISKLGRDAVFAGVHAALLKSAQLIGSLQVQSRASLGGNLCNAAPSADAVPLLISLDAIAEIAGPSGRRMVPAAAVAAGPGRTTLAADELLVSLSLPSRPGRWAAKYLRFTPRREMDIAIAGVGAWISLAADGGIADARLTLASVAPTPFVAEQAQRLLIGERPSPALFRAAGEAAAREAQPISDTRGSAAYRRELVSVLTRRTLADCAKQLGSNLT